MHRLWGFGKEGVGVKSELTRSGKSPVLLAMLLSVPAVLEQLLVTATSYVDTTMVGSLGAAATAAISVTSSCNWLINGVIMALGVGYSVRVAYYIGAQHREQVGVVLIQAVLGSLLMGGAAMAVGIPLSRVLPRWMGAQPEIRADAAMYMLILMAVLPFRTFHAVFSAVLRCMGDTKTPMGVNTLVNVLNVVLNYFLIYETRPIMLLGRTVTMPGLGMGVTGAALATAISISLGAVWLTLAAVVGKKEYRPHWRGHCRLDLHLQREALKIAVPVALERITISTGQIVMTRMVSILGTVALAANYVAVTAEQICYMPAYGIASAATALVGQSMGAADYRAAKRFGRITGAIGMGLTAFLAVAMFLCADLLGEVFSSDPEVAELSAQMLRIVSVAEPLFSLSTVMSGALRGVGEAKYPFYVGVVCMLGVRICLASIMIFGLHMGLAAVWIAMAVDLNLRGILNFTRFQKGRWIPAGEKERAI